MVPVRLVTVGRESGWERGCALRSQGTAPAPSPSQQQPDAVFISKENQQKPFQPNWLFSGSDVQISPLPN